GPPFTVSHRHIRFIRWPASLPAHHFRLLLTLPWTAMAIPTSTTAATVRSARSIRQDQSPLLEESLVRAARPTARRRPEGLDWDLKSLSTPQERFSWLRALTIRSERSHRTAWSPRWPVSLV